MALALRLRRLVPELVEVVTADRVVRRAVAARTRADGRGAGPAGRPARGRASRLPAWTPVANASSPARCGPSSGGPVGSPASTCRSPSRWRRVWTSPRCRASPTSTGPPTASSPRCCPAVRRSASGWPPDGRATPSRPTGSARSSGAHGRACGRGWLPATDCRRHEPSAPRRRRRPVERPAHLLRRSPLGRADQRGRAADRGPVAPPSRARDLPRPPRRSASAPSAPPRADGPSSAVTVAGSPWTVLSEGLAECALDTARRRRMGPWAGRCSRRPACARTVASPSGWTSLWRPCGGASGWTRRCCSTAAAGRTADGGRPRGTSAALAAARRPTARAGWSTRSPARCGAPRSSPSVEGPRWCARGSPGREWTPSPSTSASLTLRVAPSALRGRTSTAGLLIYDGR